MKVGLSGFHPFPTEILEQLSKTNETKGKENKPSPELRQLNTIITLVKKRKGLCSKMKWSLPTGVAFIFSGGLIQDFAKQDLTSLSNCTSLALLGIGAVTLSLATYSSCRAYFVGRTIIRINHELYKTQIPSIKNRCEVMESIDPIEEKPEEPNSRNYSSKIYQ